MQMMRWVVSIIGLLLLVPMLGFAQAATLESVDLVNFDHLRFLTEPITVNGQPMDIVHIYSNAPSYQWVGADGEGISAVDDTARAAIAYMQEYERTKDASLLDLAKGCLEFVMYMQTDDGEFYNFITDEQGTINKTGSTSYKSLGWWAMRGFWALGEGVRVFNSVDKAFADRLATAYLRTETTLGTMLGNYGQMNHLHGFAIPAWIGEPDVTSIGLLALAAYQQARPNATTADILTKLADGIAQYRLGDDSTYPFGMHPVQANAPGYSHTWGAHMTMALVEAGMVMHNQSWIDSAAADANSFLLRQIAFERIRQIGVVPNRLGQIAYGTNMLVQTYALLYQATRDEKYARYAGLAASWYFGNNMAGAQMYFPDTGLVYDGINGPVSWRVNQNSGAESTIEGLMSLIAIADIPQAVDLLHVKPIGGNSWQILEAEEGQRVIGTPVYFSEDWTGEGNVSGGRYVGLGEGQRMQIKFEVDQPDDYLLYVADMHTAAANSADVIQRADKAPTIDGKDDDWSSNITPMQSNTATQFLRGAGIWKGADVDSHSVRLEWDNTNLYIFADVRDPQFDQKFTLSDVWQGDTLWLYFTGSTDANKITSKVTLSQTSQGPQVWDWVNTGFLKDATLAFVQHDGGYSYEAALPWASLGITPKAGMQIGFEAGRGIGGNSFMDLTGRDPDVPSNLLHLALVEPGMSASASTTPQVALQVNFANRPAVTIPQTVSPDSDYFWLDLVTPKPVHLDKGQYTIGYRYAGAQSSNPGLSKVDAFYLQPATARRIFETPDGKMITFTYDTMTGATTWDEK